jgi:hypothetical protein
MNTPNYGQLNVSGFGAAQPSPTPIAGRFNFDKDRIQQYKDAFGSDLGAMAYLLEQQRSQASDPQRIKEMLDVIGPYQREIAKENQRLGMESAEFANIMSFPDRAFRAMAASHYYVPETMQTIAQGIGRQTPFLNRQYTSL